MSDDEPSAADADTDADGSTDANGVVDADREVDADADTEADGGGDADAAFAAELEQARELLEGDDVAAFHVGVVRGDEVDTTIAQRADDPREEGLQALSLLAAHVRLVAGEAGVDPSTVAGDAASLAGQVEEIPTRLADDE